MAGRLSPNSLCDACMSALGKPMGSFQILRHVASSLESMVVMDDGGSATRQCVCMILELALYMRRRCFIPGGKGVARSSLSMVDKVSVIHLKCAFGLREVVRIVPR